MAKVPRPIPSESRDFEQFRKVLVPQNSWPKTETFDYDCAKLFEGAGMNPVALQQPVVSGSQTLFQTENPDKKIAWGFWPLKKSENKGGKETLQAKCGVWLYASARYSRVSWPTQVDFFPKNVAGAIGA